MNTQVELAKVAFSRAMAEVERMSDCTPVKLKSVRVGTRKVPHGETVAWASAKLETSVYATASDKEQVATDAYDCRKNGMYPSEVKCS